MTTRVTSGLDPSTVLAEVDRLRAAGDRPTLALAFCGPDQDLDVLRAALVSRGMAVVGASTAGEIADASLTEDGIALLLLDAPKDAFSVWSDRRAEGETSATVAERLGRFAADRYADPVVITFGSGLTTDGEAVVNGVQAGAGRPVTLFGGLAGDNLRMVETRVASSSDVLTDGLVGLVLDGARIETQGLATSGWQPVGVEKTVTRSEGNVVFELDGESVLDVYGDTFGIEGLRDPEASIVMDIGVQFPLSIRRDDGTSVIRAPLFPAPGTGGLVFAGGVPEGSRVRFCVPPSLDIVERVVAQASALRDRAPAPDAVLLVACKARHTALGPIAEDEVEALYRLWGAPLVGYFSYGEIGAQHGGACDFHNETCSILTLRERV